MKYFAIVPAGAENLFVEELSSFGIKGSTKEEIVIFETEEIAKIAYYALIPRLICEFVSEGKTEKITAEFSDLKKFEKKSFGVRLKHPADQDLDRKKLESSTGNIINNKTSMSVDLENPDFWFSLFVSKEDFVLGIDITKELDKRPYKVFNNPQAIKGNIVAAALRFAGYNGSQNLLDPFCRSGEIAIEAALIATKTSPWKYEPIDGLESPTEEVVAPKNKIYCFDELMANVNAAKKNAKLAGVDKNIGYSKMDVSWLDTKLEENSVDLILTQPPVLSKINKKAEKTIEEFFYQSEFILKPGGRLVIITMNKEETFTSAKKYKFQIIRKHLIKSGQQDYHLFEFGRE